MWDRNPRYQKSVALQIYPHRTWFHISQPQWHHPKDPISDSAVHVTREYAERTEENWNEPFWNLHRQDMTDFECTIYSDNEKSFAFNIKDEKITLSSNGNCIFALNDDNSHRFLVQLRIYTKDIRPLEAVLPEYFGTENCANRIIQFANAVGINM